MRRITYRLYPNKLQKTKLYEILELHRILFNASLEQRINAWRLGHRVSFYDQQNELPILRKECPEFKLLNAQSSRATIKRVDLAYQNWWRKLKRGEKGGFPRFKSKARFSSFGFEEHKNGYELLDGKLYIQNIGNIKFRGKANHTGELKTCQVFVKNDKWYASITIDVKEFKRKAGNKAVGIDWGLETYATIAFEDNTFNTIQNPRWLKKRLAKLKIEQQKLSKKKRGSNNWYKQLKIIKQIHEKITNQRKDFIHKETAKLVSKSNVIYGEQLNVSKMSQSKNKGLNREILATAPYKFFSTLKYKAEEAGIKYIEIDTKKIKPTQTCSECGIQIKKELSERIHNCQCGLILTRDENASRVILKEGKKLTLPQ